MKKIALLTSALTLSACIAVPKEPVQPKKSVHEQNLENAQETYTEIIQETDVLKRLRLIATAYSYYPSQSDTDGMFYHYTEYSRQYRPYEYLEMLISPVQMKGKLHCYLFDGYIPTLKELGPNDPSYTQKQDNTKDMSDECILERRNPKIDELGFFDYKNLLPEGHKITTNHAFKQLLDDLDYYTEDFCDKQTDWTTTEKQNCRDNIKNYFENLVFGTLRSCKELSKQSKEFKTEYDINLGKLSVQDLKELFNTPLIGMQYKQGFQALANGEVSEDQYVKKMMANDAIYSMARKHMCSISSTIESELRQAYKTIKKNAKQALQAGKKKSNIVTLN